MKTHLLLTTLIISTIAIGTQPIDAQTNTPVKKNIPTTTQPSQDSDPSNPAATPAQVRAAAQQITVRITTANNGGSGVLLAKKGNTYLVLTNKHVAGKSTQFQIQTPDGKKHTATLVPNTQINPKYDLALLQFTSTQKYQLATVENGSPLTENRAIYSVGYPFDSNQPRISIGKVTQLSDVPFDDGTQIGYVIDKTSKDIKQGMSGGPIVDGRGVLLGINTIGSYPIRPSYTYFDGSKPTPKQTQTYQQANWGVPIYNLLTQLDASILYNYGNFPKVQRQVTPTGYMAKLNREARQQTVRIEASNGSNGSGVIVAKQGNTYYVLTAKHVVSDDKSKKIHSKITTITHDRERYQIQPSEIKLADGLDIAIVKFTATTSYPVAKLGNYSPVGKMTVFVGGYPDRGQIDSPLWQWQLNPGGAKEREMGKLLAQDKQSFSNGYDLIYGSISYGGMSGGPVFDTDGRVIGIHGRAEATEGTILGESLGISIQAFLGISNRLQVPKSLAVSTNKPKDLTKPELDTVTAIKNNVAKPQADSSGEQWLQYGNQLYRIGKYQESAVVFDKAIAKGKEFQLLGNYGKALSLLQIENYAPALTAINGAISTVPAKDRAKFYYLWKYQSFMLLKLEKYDEALKAVDVAIGFQPNEPILLAEKAFIFFYKKEFQKSIATFDRAINLGAGAYAYAWRGVAKLNLGQIQASITDYDRVIALNPNYIDAYFIRGMTKIILGQKQAAKVDFDRAIAIDPIQASNLFVQIAKQNFNSNEYQNAINVLDRAIAVNPKYADAYVHRGRAKYELKQYQSAIADFDRAISIDPKQGFFYGQRGRAKYELKQYQSAIADFDRAISIDPKNTWAYSIRGTIKYDLKQYQAAIADYDRAIAIDRNYSLAYSMRGSIKYDLKQYQAAIADFDRAISIDPKNTWPYVNRGTIKYELKQYQSAIADFDRAISIDRDYFLAYAMRGATKYELKQYQSAIADFDRVIAIEPKSVQAYIDRGRAKDALGQKQAAISDFDRAIAIAPNNAKAYGMRGAAKDNLGQKQAAIIDLTKSAELLRKENNMKEYQVTIDYIQDIKKRINK